MLQNTAKKFIDSCLRSTIYLYPRFLYKNQNPTFLLNLNPILTMSPAKQYTSTTAATKPPMKKTSFAQTCNQLSVFLKERGSLKDLHRGINPKFDDTGTHLNPLLLFFFFLFRYRICESYRGLIESFP